MQVICPVCDRQTQADSRRCEHCGQPLGADASVDVYDLPLGEGNATAGGNAGDWSWQPRSGGDDDLSDGVLAGIAATHRQPDLILSTTGLKGRLLVLAQDGSEQVERDVVLDGTNVIIGRAPTCAVSLPDDQLVSRLHAMLEYTGQGYILRDLGSSNGTQVNGTPIGESTVLTEGDRITIGKRTLVFTETVTEAQARESLQRQKRVAVAFVSIPDHGADGSASNQLPLSRAAQVPPTERNATSGAFTVSFEAPIQVTTRDDKAAPVPATGELDQMRGRLVEMTTLLSQLTEDIRLQNKWLRTELTQLAQQVGATLAELEETATGATAAGGDGIPNEAVLADLIHVAEQAAGDPHHINSLLALAGRAGDVVAALRVEHRLIGEVRRVRDRLAELARAAGW